LTPKTYLLVDVVVADESVFVAEDDGTADEDADDDDDDNDNDDDGGGGCCGEDDLWLCDAVKLSCISRSGVAAATEPLLSLAGTDDDKADENAAEDNADDCIELRN